MPVVPTVTYAEPKNPVTGDQYVKPENVLVAAANMHDMGRLFEGSGGRFGGLKGQGSRAKPGKSLKAK